MPVLLKSSLVGLAPDTPAGRGEAGARPGVPLIEGPMD